jgi:hypothetical protein
MKTVKILIASVIFSVGVHAQTAKNGKGHNPEERAKFQTEKMKNELTLTNEQVEKAYQINLEAIKKNKELSEEKLTSKERKEAVRRNNENRMKKFKEVLSEEQFNKIKEDLKDKKKKNDKEDK